MDTLLEKVSLQGFLIFYGGAGLGGDAEGIDQTCQELKFRSERGVQNQMKEEPILLFFEHVEQNPADRGFPGADIPKNDVQPSLQADGNFKPLEALVIFRGIIKEIIESSKYRIKPLLSRLCVIKKYF